MKIKKLYPSLIIVLPLLAVAAFSSANGGVSALFANAGYGGEPTMCSEFSSMTVSPASRTVTPGEHIDFNGRNFAHEQDINVYRDGTLVGKAHADGGGNFTTGSITTPNTAGTYTYTFIGVICSTPVTSVITVSGNDGGDNPGTGTSTPPTNPPSSETYNPTITPSSKTVSPGEHIDFGGRNFAHEEDVTVTLNGSTVTHAHADGGGNFTTGSITLPSTPGTYTYTFTGGTSNTPVTSTITVPGSPISAQ